VRVFSELTLHLKPSALTSLYITSFVGVKVSSIFPRIKLFASRFIPRIRVIKCKVPRSAKSQYDTFHYFYFLINSSLKVTTARRFAKRGADQQHLTSGNSRPRKQPRTRWTRWILVDSRGLRLGGKNPKEVPRIMSCGGAQPPVINIVSMHRSIIAIRSNTRRPRAGPDASLGYHSRLLPRKGCPPPRNST
jgi:hypothetical protein